MKSSGSANLTQEINYTAREMIRLPLPVTDGKHVWVVTGTGAVAAFDMEGKEIWKRNLQDDYGRFGLNWGYASSPLLHNGHLDY